MDTIQIAQRRRILWIESQVLAVLETAAGQQNRHVLDAVRGGIAQVAAEEDHGAIEQGGAFLLRLLQLGQEGGAASSSFPVRPS